MRTVLLALVLAILGGCTTVDHTFYVDARFTQAEESQLSDAADTWCVASDGRACFDLVFGQTVQMREDGRRVLVRATEDEANASPWDDLYATGANVPGLTVTHDGHAGPDRQTIVLVPSRLGDMTLQRIAVHEFGHAWGLEHTQVILAAMNPMAPPGDQMVAERCLSRSDLLQLRDHVDLSGAALRECRF